MKRLTLLGAAAALALAGCDAGTPASNLSTADQETAATVLASVLADQSNGFAADLNDVNGMMDRSGLDYGRALLGGGRGFGDRFWRPFDRQAGRVTYDPATGTFRLVYDRADSTRGFVRTARADLAYRYLTADGAIVSEPLRDRKTVNKVVYAGTREGSEKATMPGAGSLVRTYSSQAAWTLDALTTATATFAGQQQSSGSMTLSRPDSLARKTTYTATLTPRNVTITRRDSLTAPEARVKGTMAYAVTTTVQRGTGTPTTRTIEGTIELDGRGGAILRFDGLGELSYLIHLRDGSRERRGR